MKIAICDDEAAQCEQLRQSVTTFFQTQKLPIEIDIFENASQLLFACNDHCDYDIALLDIQMDGMNGMELAAQLRKQQEHLAIIFVTGITDYIYESFQVQAINYLLKPYDEERLSACLNKAVKQLNKQEDYLLLQIDKELLRISEKHILHINSDGHYLVVYTVDKAYRIKMTMKDIENQLHGKQFLKIGRSDLISLDYVEKITGKQVVMSNSACIPIPKGKHKEISQQYMEYHFRGNVL